MRNWLVPALALVAVVLATAASAAPGKGNGHLEMYTATVPRADVAKLVREGYDVVAVRPAGERAEVDLVLSQREQRLLERRGVELRVKRDRNGKSQTQLAAEQAAGGYVVWRSWDEAGGIRDELRDIAQKNPKIVKLEVLGHTAQGREILALKVTRDATKVADGSRPVAMYAATQRAREWISTEVARRLLHYFVDNYGKDAHVTNLVDTRELWFLPVANPDGYQYTFDHERLWRKNLRDNDGDGQITGFDGVDPNRNVPEDWNYDNEGSAGEQTSLTYRGTAAGSEQETKAYTGLLDRIRPCIACVSGSEAGPVPR